MKSGRNKAPIISKKPRRDKSGWHILSRIPIAQEMMKVVSWNCRGLGGSTKVEAIKDIIKSEKAGILLIQETKMSEAEIMGLSRIWKNYHGKAISSKGASGGIATLISNKFSIKSTMESQQWLLTEIQEKDDANSLYICNVYGPMHYKDNVIF